MSRSRLNPEGSTLPGFSMPIQALFIQLIAFAMAFFVFQLIHRLSGWMVNPLVFGLSQGAVALLISWWRGLHVWWLPIQLLFPLAMFLLLALQISPLWYLGAFFILLVLFWGAVVTRVPLFLSRKAVWETVAGLLPKDKPVRVIDLGSGTGGLVMRLAALRPDCAVTGIEISPFLWLFSTARALIQRSQARFLLGSYNRHHLGKYDVVFTFLSPLVMDSLWLKAKKEMRPGTLLLSLEFAVEDEQPDLVIPVENRILYGWRM